MAQRIFEFDKDYGIQLADSRSKSTLEATSGFCKDLTNCGSNTHMQVNAGANLNYTPNCQTGLAPYVGLSMRSVSKIGNTITNSGATVAPPPLDDILDSMIAFLANRVFTANNVLGDPASYTAGAWKLLGKTYVLNQGDITYNLTVPRVETQFDQCGIQTAQSVNASISAQILKEFCVPELYFAVSARALWGTIPGPVAGPFDVLATAEAAAGVLSDTFYLPAAPTNAGCAELSRTIVDGWRTGNDAATLPLILTITDDMAAAPVAP